MNDHLSDDMDKKVERIAYLIAGYIRNTLTEKEHDELDEWVSSSDQNMQLFEELTDEKNIWANLSWMDQVKAKQLYGQMKEAGSFELPEKLTKRSRIRGLWIAAAVAVTVGTIFLINRISSGNEKPTIATKEKGILQPGGNRATLTLADGTVIDLTTAGKGLLKSEKGSDISKPADGELVYEVNDSIAEAGVIHTLSTPAGGQFQVRLPDGTKVWLNAASSLKYPARFTGKQRSVELTGEAYFEVAKNEKQPFVVGLSDSTQVTVLGTHFNVTAYPGEKEKEITLLEGKVSVNTPKNAEQIVPGMEVLVNGEEIQKKVGVDTDEITGWKNGLFVFHDASMESIMRQVERWYDAKVEFKGVIKQQFNASILRSEPLSKLLHLLELNGYVHFRTENNIIYVSP